METETNDGRKTEGDLSTAQSTATRTPQAITSVVRESMGGGKVSRMPFFLMLLAGFDRIYKLETVLACRSAALRGLLMQRCIPQHVLATLESWD